MPKDSKDSKASKDKPLIGHVDQGKNPVFPNVYKESQHRNIETFDMLPPNPELLFITGVQTNTPLYFAMFNKDTSKINALLGSMQPINLDKPEQQTATAPATAASAAAPKPNK